MYNPLAQGATARASDQASNHTLRYPAIFHSQDILTASFTNVSCLMAGSIEDSRHGMANSSDECPTCFMRNSFNDFEDDNCCATCWSYLMALSALWLSGDNVTLHKVLMLMGQIRRRGSSLRLKLDWSSFILCWPCH